MGTILISFIVFFFLAPFYGSLFPFVGCYCVELRLEWFRKDLRKNFVLAGDPFSLRTRVLSFIMLSSLSSIVSSPLVLCAWILELSVRWMREILGLNSVFLNWTLISFLSFLLPSSAIFSSLLTQSWIHLFCWLHLMRCFNVFSAFYF